MKLRATVVYEWEEDEENWEDEMEDGLTLSEAVEEYVAGDWSYLTDMDVKTLEIEEIDE